MNGCHIYAGAKVTNAMVGPLAIVKEEEVIDGDPKDIALVTKTK